MEIEIGKIPSADVVIYEYGVRLDKECEQAAGDQIMKARRLYNALVACIRGIVADLQSFVVREAGPEAQALQLQIDALGDAFAQAKARSDEPTMKQVAQDRRLLWRELAEKLKGVRQAQRSTIQSRYLSRIGKNAGCETYKLRCQAVADGLGWATTNAILDAALIASRVWASIPAPPRLALTR